MPIPINNDSQRSIGGAVSDIGKGLGSVISTSVNTAKNLTVMGVAQNLFDEFVPLERYTEYLRSYNFEVAMPSDFDVEGMIISKYCFDISVGNYNITDISNMEVGPKKAFYAGSLDIDTVTLKFRTPAPNMVFNYFKSWRNLIIDEAGHYNPSGAYKRPIYVMLYTQQKIRANTMKLIGCFPKSLPKYDLSYATEDVLNVSIEMQIDDVEVTGVDLVGSLVGASRWLMR